MKTKSRFNKGIIVSNTLIGDYSFKCTNRTKEIHFTRERKMGFKETIMFMINMVNKSLQVELNNYFETILNKDNPSTKQAYSKARQNIEAKAFIQLNDKINELVYKDEFEYKLWNGYRLSAIDGSVIQLPDTKLLRKEFGYIENQKNKVARARVSCILDVLNKIVIESKIDIYKASERNMAKELILKMLKNRTESELILFDRGYPGTKFFSFLKENNVEFLMRAKVNFSKDIKNAKQPDQIINIKNGKEVLTVRVVRFLLSSGIEEVLITSLLDKKYTLEDLKELYFKRWCVEVKYDELKNRLEIENFTGRTKKAIEQDFYASIYLSNMIELARQESDKIIKEKNKGKNLKHEYKTNLNILIGSLKDKLIIMMLEKDRGKRTKMFKNIMKQASQNTIPIRLGRQYPRKDSVSRCKYKANCKRSL
ncbi:IS4 family transposase [Clostridium botulinum]|uniref:IS4 family transposase n=1 Tax=Clostridium botulinum TaxID=1491 RepID=UPI001E5B7E92|nr:IS4 family transposase [Clostridium botulinum]